MKNKIKYSHIKQVNPFITLMSNMKAHVIS